MKILTENSTNISINKNYVEIKSSSKDNGSLNTISDSEIKPLPSPVKTSRVILKFKKLTENGMKPIKGSVHAAGYDLFSAHDYTVPPRGKELIKTDLQVKIPEGCYGRVAPRSGLAWKHSIHVGAGVIDRDYRGNLGVVLFNLSDKEFEVKRGDRVAQLICEKIEYPELEEVEELEESERGDNGFGSTGK